MNAAIISLFGLGFLLGLKHAFDADHIAAISALNSKNPSLRGFFWGIGHTISLFAAGCLILIFKITISEKLALSFEFIVGLMLAVLGFNVLITLRKNKFHFHKHRHHAKEHIHLHSHLATKNHSHGHTPLLIGLIHGLAGSAALALLALSAISSVTVGLFYILVFGVGSVIGMVIISSMISLPFKILANKFDSVNRIMKLSTGLASLMMGIGIMYGTMLLF